jgi:5-methyltetrahydrofolate--homocysteine methyltransferase
MSPEASAALASETRASQAALRETHAGGTGGSLVPYDEAAARRPALVPRTEDVSEPPFTGTRVVADLELDEIVPYIDWTPFFHVWELKGIYPRILDRPGVGPAAREVYDNAQVWLRRIVGEELVRARAVYGYFPAASDGDDIILYDSDSRSKERCRLHMLRQQQAVGRSASLLCLADFVAPASGGVQDFLGAFAVTAGLGVDELVASLEREQDEYGAIMVKALADRLAEALAEMLHERVRREWYDGAEALDKEALIAEHYRGIRPAIGYPACPDHTEKRTLFDLLGGEEAARISLTETFAMIPAASVSGLYFAHPQARYFSVGRVGPDQVAAYAARKGWSRNEAERWLAPNLSR